MGVSAEWMEWGNWAPCPNPCGGEKTRRMRFCTEPFHASCGGGSSQSDKKYCGSDPCGMYDNATCKDQSGDAVCQCDDGFRDGNDGSGSLDCQPGTININKLFFVCDTHQKEVALMEVEL